MNGLCGVIRRNDLRASYVSLYAGILQRPRLSFGQDDSASILGNRQLFAAHCARNEAACDVLALWETGLAEFCGDVFCEPK